MEWLNYHHLLYFWTVVREGGVTRAADRLHRVPSNVTTRIKQFEERLGVTLFRRQGRGLEQLQGAQSWAELHQALRDNGLELALGAHAANNLVAALVVNHPNSSLPTRAVWEVSDLNPTAVLVGLLVCALVFSWVMTGRGRCADR